MSKIIIIDDDHLICQTLSRIFSEMGHEVIYFLTLKDGLEAVRSENHDIIFLDVQLPDGNGLENIKTIQKSPASPEVIIITGFADPDGAELAIQNNVWDYIKKPVAIDDITLSLKRALQYREEKTASQSAITLIRDNIIGDSRQIRSCLDIVARSAKSMANVLITGETGTGKELFARAIHANSNRHNRNFVVVDCGSLPESLMESILFGHKKGAFTGADRAAEGLVKHADGGTLFLDEVGELPLRMQKVFLRVLQERRFHPVGGTKEVKSDFRLVAATNRDLDKLVKSGKFREDLLFRLRAVTIHLPPLRERMEDLKDLALNHIVNLCEAGKEPMKGYSSDFFKVLSAYAWPGNVRELYGTLESAVVQARYESTLFPKHLPTAVRIQIARSSLKDTSEGKSDTDDHAALFPSKPLPKWKEFRKIILAEKEKEYLKKLAAVSNGNIKKASSLSGLSSPRLYELMRKHRISNP